MDPTAGTAAAVTAVAPVALGRQELADLGQRQVVELMRTGKHLIDQYAQLQPTPAAQQQLAAVQEQYLRLSADIQATLQQCQALQQREQEAAAAAAAAQAAPPGQEAAAAGLQGGDPDSSVAELQAQVAALRQQLQRKNALIKQVLDRLRHMMDAFTMWEAHKRHLVQHAVQYAAAGTGSIA